MVIAVDLSFYVYLVIARESTCKKPPKDLRFACSSGPCWCTHVYKYVFLNVHSFPTIKAVLTSLWKEKFRNGVLHPFPIRQPCSLLVKHVWIPLATVCNADACCCGFCSESSKSATVLLFIFKFLPTSQMVNHKSDALEKKIWKPARPSVIFVLPVAFYVFYSLSPLGKNTIHICACRGTQDMDEITLP